MNLTVRFFATALFYLLAASALGLALLLGVSYPYPAHTHLALLGWVSLTIMGAMYQIVPTLTGRELPSKTLAEGQFYLMNIGLLALFLAFLLGDWTLLPFAAGIVLLASLLFLYLVFGTIGSGERLTLSLKFFSAALLYYLAAVAFGLLITLGVWWGGRPISIHAHLAGAGFISLTIVGAMYQMVPMLALKELRGEGLGRWVFYLLNAGVLGIMAGFWTGAYGYVALAGVVFAIGALIFAGSMLATIGPALRGWRGLDISVKYFVASILYLLAAVTLGLLMALGVVPLALKSAHAHVALLGWVSITIVGAMYHILPMLIWVERYGPKLGLEEVPTMKELYGPGSAEVQFWIFNLGVIALGAGILLRYAALTTVGGGIFLLGAILFAYVMYRMIF